MSVLSRFTHWIDTSFAGKSMKLTRLEIRLPGDIEARAVSEKIDGVWHNALIEDDWEYIDVRGYCGDQQIISWKDLDLRDRKAADERQRLRDEAERNTNVRAIK